MLSLGIVGLPNVGESSLFNALTAAKADAANFPFCTVEPNVGMVEVPDPRLARIEAVMDPPPKRVTPATVQFVDIAGLVKGALQGEGQAVLNEGKTLWEARPSPADIAMLRSLAAPHRQARALCGQRHRPRVARR